MEVNAKCAIELIEAAGKSHGSRAEAIGLMQTASPAPEGAPGIASIACDKCGVELDITTDLGENRAQLKLPPTHDKAIETCISVTRVNPGGWVTNLGNRWFNIDLLDKSAQDIVEAESEHLTVSKNGLKTILHDTAHKLSQINGKDNLQKDILGATKTEQLKLEIDTTVEVLETTLVRNDGKTWREEIETHANQT